VSDDRVWLRHPDSWTVTRVTTVGPFVTRIVFRPDAGPDVEWSSRRHRKGLGLTAPEATTAAGWRPERIGRAVLGRLNWWIGILFMIGSAAFALGSAPVYSGHVAASTVGVTFFVGSIFFTTAAFLQYLQAVGVDETVGLVDRRSWRRRVLTVQPRRIDWWATAVQFVGTLFFNMSTFAALDDSLSITQEDRRIWAPDALGSICFLVASAFALIEAGHAFWSWKPRDHAWRIAALNMLGSVFFGISAVASYVLPDTGELLNTWAANAFTFLGAVCFLLGAYLLLPEDAGRT
jgi:hypothetical protein